MEFTVASLTGDLAVGLRKLENANKEIEIALRLLAEGPTKINYRALRDRIQRGLRLWKS
jgi:hypothetical protein